MSNKEFEEKYNDVIQKVQKAWDKEDIVEKEMEDLVKSLNKAKSIEDQIALVIRTTTELSITYSQDLVGAALQDLLVNDSNANDGSRS